MKTKKKMRRATAALLASIMASLILLPIIIGIAFGLYAYDVPAHGAAAIIIVITLVIAKLLAPHINDFVSMYD